jgi:hypothetical protein
MADLCQIARNSVATQADVFRYAERDHGLSIKRLHLRTDIPVNTLRGWASGNTAMPAWAMFKLGKQGGIPDHLLSLIGEGFERHVGTDENGDGDLDTAALDANEFQAAVQRARHPASPGGTAIVPQEVAEIVPIARRSVSSTRRAVAA